MIVRLARIDEAAVVGALLPGQSSAGESDAFISKFDASGNLLWTRQFGTSALDLAYFRFYLGRDGSGTGVSGMPPDLLDSLRPVRHARPQRRPC